MRKSKVISIIFVLITLTLLLGLVRINRTEATQTNVTFTKTVNCVKNQSFILSLNGSFVKYLNNCYIEVDFDNTKLTLADVCASTDNIEVKTGSVNTSNMTISYDASTEGKIKFNFSGSKLASKTWSGVLNTVKFTPNFTGTTTVKYSYYMSSTSSITSTPTYGCTATPTPTKILGGTVTPTPTCSITSVPTNTPTATIATTSDISGDGSSFDKPVVFSDNDKEKRIALWHKAVVNWSNWKIQIKGEAFFFKVTSPRTMDFKMKVHPLWNSRLEVGTGEKAGSSRIKTDVVNSLGYGTINSISVQPNTLYWVRGWSNILMIHDKKNCDITITLEEK